MRVWTALVWPFGGLLWICKCSFEFDERQGMFYAAGQESLCSRELVTENYCLEHGCVASGRNIQLF